MWVGHGIVPSITASHSSIGNEQFSIGTVAPDTCGELDVEREVNRGEARRRCHKDNCDKFSE